MPPSQLLNMSGWSKQKGLAHRASIFSQWLCLIGLEWQEVAGFRLQLHGFFVFFFNLGLTALACCVHAWCGFMRLILETRSPVLSRSAQEVDRTPLLREDE